VADYLRAAAAMDASIGRLLDKLDAMAATQDTVVVYTSDQGCTPARRRRRSAAIFF
jgi:arylsulfatase A-like enzyme